MATRKVTVIECDRCHDEMDLDLFKAEGGHVIIKMPHHKGKREQKPLDLCPSCRVQLERFLEMKLVDN